jgi:hypothetical protein
MSRIVNEAGSIGGEELARLRGRRPFDSDGEPDLLAARNGRA